MSLIPPSIVPGTLNGYTRGFYALPDVQPFTQRSAVSYTELLESLQRWIPNTLIPYLQSTLPAMQASWEGDVTALEAAVNTALSGQADTVNVALAAMTQSVASMAKSAVDAEAAALLSVQNAVNDPSILAVLQSATSATRGWLDAQYVNEGALDATTLAMLQAATSATLAFLDQRYAGEAVDDLGMTNVLGTTGSSTVRTLDGMYLRSVPAIADPFLASVFAAQGSTAVETLDGRYVQGDAGKLDPLVAAALQLTASKALAVLDARYRQLTQLGGRDWMTAAQRAALVTANLKYGYVVVETDTGKAYKWTRTWGWVLWDSGEGAWTKYTYLAGYSNTSGNSLDLQWIIREGHLTVRGIAFGTFNGNYPQVTVADSHVPPAQYRAGSGEQLRGWAVGSSGRSGAAVMQPDGSILVAYYANGTDTGPNWMEVGFSVPMGANIGS